MSQVQLNGLPVASGEVVMPLRGAWSATLEVVATEPTTVEGAVSLVLGATTLVGTATRAQADRGERVTVRVVAGAGGLGAAPPPAHFVSQSRRVILTDALAAGAERLSTTSTGLDDALSQWTRTAGTVGDAVQRVAAAMGATWRHLPDGTVWIGRDTYPAPAVEVEHVIVREEPTQDRLIVAVEGAVVLPGVTFLGRRVTGVRYSVSSGAIRATVSYGEARDPMAAAIGALVRRETAQLDFYATYTARVVGQNGDESLELQPSDARLPGMSRVPMRPGHAGVTSQLVPSGSTALLAFENGDESRPYVAGFVGASATAITWDAAVLQLGALATAFAARADLVDANFAAIPAAILAHSHASFGAPGTSITPFVPSPVAATKVLVE